MRSIVILFFPFIFRARRSTASVAFTIMWLKRKENDVRVKSLTSSEVLLNEVVILQKFMSSRMAHPQP